MNQEGVKGSSLRSRCHRVEVAYLDERQLNVRVEPVTFETSRWLQNSSGDKPPDEPAKLPN